jgi:hypothetical protein
VKRATKETQENAVLKAFRVRKVTEGMLVPKEFKDCKDLLEIKATLEKLGLEVRKATLERQVLVVSEGKRVIQVTLEFRDPRGMQANEEIEAKRESKESKD